MNKSQRILSLVLLATINVTAASAREAATLNNVEPAATTAPAFGIIRGTVRDERGAPIAGAVIALWREGLETVRQVQSASDGSFAARVAPGRYSLTAMASGFNVVSLPDVDVQRSEDIAFRFNLVRVGSGSTLPERRADRRNPKWRILANQSRRTIYQNNEGTGETIAQIGEQENVVEEKNVSRGSSSSGGTGQSVLATYVASSSNSSVGNYAAVNFATLQPIGDNLEFVFIGQTGIGQNAPQRVETAARLKVNDQHRVSFSLSGAEIGRIQNSKTNTNQPILGQASFQAFDEWRVKDNLIVVLGVDYSRFVGASQADSLAPRVGLQFDANAKTRFHAAYAMQNESRTWQQAAELEGNRIFFSEPNFDSYAFSDQAGAKKALMPRLRRFEFGVERVLDNASSIETTAFFDATANRGIGFVTLPATNFADAVLDNDLASAIQNGSAQGVRLVYARRLNKIFDATIGYAAGRGQQLSDSNLTNPANLFENSLFQTIAAQISADLNTGTKINAVWRYAPSRAVFALDPFAGRLTMYDPSLSIYVTQDLPTLGLPVRARATFDARNLFDFQTTASDNEAILKLNSNQRVLRGGIAVRF